MQWRSGRGLAVLSATQSEQGHWKRLAGILTYRPNVGCGEVEVELNPQGPG